MCRWLAYMGAPIFLDTLLTKPEHSLIDQSQFARMNFVKGFTRLPGGALPTNGDGFGVGWYGAREYPGVYRDTRPAWNDMNLQHMASQIKSSLFFAHVRAATSGVQRSNCHPFSHGGWLFQHNGEINGFDTVRRELLFDVAPELFGEIRGTTDTETCFYLALTYGLQDDAPKALARMVGRVERAREHAGIEAPFLLTCAATDGQRIFALRYASDQGSKTLFVGRHLQALREIDGDREAMPPGAMVIVSEPLDDLNEHWEQVPDATLLTAENGTITLTPFAPEL